MVLPTNTGSSRFLRTVVAAGRDRPTTLGRCLTIWKTFGNGVVSAAGPSVHATAVNEPGAVRSAGGAAGGVLAPGPKGRSTALIAIVSLPLEPTKTSDPSGPAANELIDPVLRTIMRSPPPLTPGVVYVNGSEICRDPSPTSSSPFEK